MRPRVPPAPASAYAPPTCCPVCDSEQTHPIFERTGVPIHIGIQWPSAEEARRCSRGDIALHYCSRCEHVFNAAFEPSQVEYDEAYDNALDYSTRFRQYLNDLATGLVERHDLHGKDLVEVGCGKGAFLTLLARLGENRAVGFDPSYEPGRLSPAETEQVTFVRDYYSDRYASAYPADFVCCRHVLEHVPDPIEFLRSIRLSAGGTDGAAVYFEVPNLALILRDLSVWDVIYEHHSYFSIRSLAYAFARSGYRVRDVYEAYDGQFLGLEAVVQTGDENHWAGLPSLHELATTFAARVAARTTAWARRLHELGESGGRIVLWGAGSKAVGFTNLLEDVTAQEASPIDYAVDINPHKQGSFLPGTGQEIVAPDFLVDYRPTAVVAMNPIYRDEIQQTLADLGVSAALYCAS